MIKEFTAKIKLVRFVFLFFAVFLIFCFVSEKSFAFDFSEDVASRFFWTKSYKAKHPKPTNKMPKTMAEYYKEANKAAVQMQDIPAPRYVKDKSGSGTSTNFSSLTYLGAGISCI